MKRKRLPSKRFLLSLLIPILVLSSMLIKPVSTMLKGENVTLATVPVDPRDLLYGDYVTLDLEIEEVDVNKLNKELKDYVKEHEYGKEIPVYVYLYQDEYGIFHVNNVSMKHPVESFSDGLYIKGKMTPYINDNSWNEEAEFKETVTVDYGIDRFYVEEGTGLELENQSRKGQVLVSAKIHSGYPILTGIKGVK